MNKTHFHQLGVQGVCQLSSCPSQPFQNLGCSNRGHSI